VLEYYEGTMFLTTNRVQTFDPAFQSRIHISLEYQELSVESRRTVWANFLGDGAQEKTEEPPAEKSQAGEAEGSGVGKVDVGGHALSEADITRLAGMQVNGRQIKNILKIARLLASRKGETLKYEHIVTTLDVTQHLHNETRATERTRGSLYG
jgi:hypothetical protein